jgi:hypothetical protein
MVDNLVVPVFAYFKEKRHGEAALALMSRTAGKKSTAEKESELEPYESTFKDYDELAVQYGFVVLFIAALPITPFIALLGK